MAAIILAGVIFLFAVGLPSFELIRYYWRERRHRQIEDRRTMRTQKIDKAWKEALARKHAEAGKPGGPDAPGG